MATYIKGSAVENATSYKLYIKEGTSYTELATQSEGGEINFKLDDYSLEDGTYTFVVKAFDSTGNYDDSSYSNELEVTIGESASGGDDTGSDETEDVVIPVGSTISISETGATLYENTALSTTDSSANTSNTSYYSYRDVPVTPGATYQCNYARRIWEFDSEGNAIKTFAAHTDVTDYTFTVSDTTTNIAICIKYTDITTPTNATITRIS